MKAQGITSIILGGMVLLMLASAGLGQDSLNVTKVGEIQISGSARSVAVLGTYAYLAAYSAGLRIINISDPTVPTEEGFFDTTGWALDVAVKGNYVYEADDWAGMRIINVYVPSNPTFEGSCFTLGSTNAVAISGDYAYIAADFAGLCIIDISVPAEPDVVVFFDTPGFSTDVEVKNDTAYVADNNSGWSNAVLRIIDCTEPNLPYEIGSIEIPGYATGIAVSTGTAFVACGDSGLWILNVAYPSMPEVIGHYNVSVTDVIVMDSFAFLACGNLGLRVLSIFDPTNPIEIGYYTTPGWASGVTVSGAFAYVADGGYFGIYDCSAAMPVNPFTPPKTPPSECTFNPPHPNPFNPTTVLSFELRVPSYVALEVFDVNGRAVGARRCLAPMDGRPDGSPLQTWYPAGTHQITFDGADLPSGLYFAKLTAGDFSQVQKLVLLK